MLEELTIEWTPETGPRRRIRFEPRTDTDGFWRIEEEWNGCKWRVTGRGTVTDTRIRQEAVLV